MTSLPYRGVPSKTDYIMSRRMIATTARGGELGSRCTRRRTMPTEAEIEAVAIAIDATEDAPLSWDEYSEEWRNECRKMARAAHCFHHPRLD